MKPVVIGGLVAVAIVAAFAIGMQADDEPDTLPEAVGQAGEDLADAIEN